jgi:hypothetical protein
MKFMDFLAIGIAAGSLACAYQAIFVPPKWDYQDHTRDYKQRTRTAIVQTATNTNIEATVSNSKNNCSLFPVDLLDLGHAYSPLAPLSPTHQLSPLRELNPFSHLQK